MFQIHLFSSDRVAQLHLALWKAGRKGEEGGAPAALWIPEVNGSACASYPTGGWEWQEQTQIFKKLGQKLYTGEDLSRPLSLRLQERDGKTHPSLASGSQAAGPLPTQPPFTAGWGTTCA